MSSFKPIAPFYHSTFAPFDPSENPKTSSYFSTFPGFHPSPNTSVQTEFQRLARHQKWKPGRKRYNDERIRCFGAEYETHFGAVAREGRLDLWQDLCAEIGVGGETGSIKKCKKVLRGVHVNLIDLIDSRRSGTQVRRFPNLAALRSYTGNGKTFPRAVAKQDVLMKIFLKEMF